MENYNLKTRNIIDNWVKDGLISGLSMSESIQKIVDLIYVLYNYGSIENQVFISYLLNVAYLDAYKMYSYRQKECVSTDREEDFYGELYDIENYENLFTKVSDDPVFLEKILSSTYEFNSLPSLGKNLIIKALYPNENDWLLENYPLHQQDLDSYKIPITKDMLIDFIKEKQQYQHYVMSIDFPEAIICSLTGFLQNLKKLDEENALDLLAEIAKNDYCSSKYLVSKINKNNEILIDHIDIYENYSSDEILYNLCNNQEFLKDALWMLYNTYISHEFDGTSLTPTIISCIKKEDIDKKLILK